MSDEKSEQTIGDVIRRGAEDILCETLSTPLRARIAVLIGQGVPEDVVLRAIDKEIGEGFGGTLSLLVQQCRVWIRRCVAAREAKGSPYE